MRKMQILSYYFIIKSLLGASNQIFQTTDYCRGEKIVWLMVVSLLGSVDKVMLVNKLDATELKS